MSAFVLLLLDYSLYWSTTSQTEGKTSFKGLRMMSVISEKPTMSSTGAQFEFTLITGSPLCAFCVFTAFPSILVRAADALPLMSISSVCFCCPPLCVRHQRRDCSSFFSYSDPAIRHSHRTVAVFKAFKSSFIPHLF